MPSCVDCGADLNPEDRVCPLCGAVLVQPALHRKPDLDTFVMGVVAAMALLLALAGSSHIR
jgi:hypothetical protein